MSLKCYFNVTLMLPQCRCNNALILLQWFEARLFKCASELLSSSPYSASFRAVKTISRETSLFWFYVKTPTLLNHSLAFLASSGFRSSHYPWKETVGQFLIPLRIARVFHGAHEPQLCIGCLHVCLRGWGLYHMMALALSMRVWWSLILECSFNVALMSL